MAESKIRDNNYYQVTGWMLNRLGLKGTALQIYAIIYGFSQDGESSFTGSLQYLMDFTNTSSKHTIIKALKELTEKGYIIKTESLVNGVQFNTYKINAQVVQKMHWGSAETAPGGSEKNTPPGSAENAPNNKGFYNKPFDNKGDKKDIPAADYSETTFSEDMKAKVDQWLQYKSERSEDYQPTGLKSLITQIQNNVNKYGETAVVDLIGDCMANGYRGIIFDRLKAKQATGGRKEVVPGWMNNSQSVTDRMKKDLAALSPEAMAKAERLKREFAQGKEQGNGIEAS